MRARSLATEEEGELLGRNKSNHFLSITSGMWVIYLKLSTSKAGERRGEPAFGFVLEEKLLLDQSSCGFSPLWLAFGF
jgi:hypothetical protein